MPIPSSALPTSHDANVVVTAVNNKPAAGDPDMLLPYKVRQPLYASDVMIAEVNGTATNNVGFDFLAYFENLPGADQRLLSWPEVDARAKEGLHLSMQTLLLRGRRAQLSSASSNTVAMSSTKCNVS